MNAGISMNPENEPDFGFVQMWNPQTMTIMKVPDDDTRLLGCVPVCGSGIGAKSVFMDAECFSVPLQMKALREKMGELT